MAESRDVEAVGAAPPPEESPAEAPRGRRPIEWWEIGAVVAVVLLAAALRMYGLATKSFWVDEIKAVIVSGSLQQSLIETGFGHEPPLRYFLLHYLIRLNPPELWARLPSYLLGVASVPLLWLLGRRLFGVGAAVTAAFLLALSPWHIVESQDARMYTVMLFFWLLSLVCFLAALERPKQGLLWVALAVVHAVNFYLSYLTIFVLAAEALVLIVWLVVRVLREGRRFAKKPYAIGALIFAGFFGFLVSFWSPYLIQLYQSYVYPEPPSGPIALPPNVRQVPWPAQFDSKFLIQFFDQLLIPGPPWRLAAFLGLVMGLWLCWRRNWPFALIGLLSFAIAMAAILLTGMRHFVAPRYLFHMLLFAVTAYAVVFATIGEHVLARAPKGAPRALAAAVLAAIALGLLYIAAPVIQLHVKAERQYWKQAVAFLTARMQPDEALIIGPWETDWAMLYYGRQFLEGKRPVFYANSIERTESALAQSGGRAWFIIWGYLPEELARLLQERFEPVAVFPGLKGTIHIYRARP